MPGTESDSGAWLLQVCMGVLHGLGSVADVLQHLGVGVGVLQSISLELDS